MARWSPDAQRSRFRSTLIVFPDGLWQAARPLLSFHENACGVGTHDFGQRPFIKAWFLVHRRGKSLRSPYCRLLCDWGAEVVLRRLPQLHVGVSPLTGQLHLALGFGWFSLVTLSREIESRTSSTRSLLSCERRPRYLFLRPAKTSDRKSPEIPR